VTTCAASCAPRRIGRDADRPAPVIGAVGLVRGVRQRRPRIEASVPRHSVDLHGLRLRGELAGCEQQRARTPQTHLASRSCQLDHALPDSVLFVSVDIEQRRRSASTETARAVSDAPSWPGQC
jgi:hypothetical protein